MNGRTFFLARDSRVLAVAILVAVFGVTGCSNTASKGSTIKGERISILEKTRKIEADSDLKTIKPHVPNVEVVKNWAQTGYNAAHKMPNAALEAQPKEIWSADIGNGSSSDYKLLSKPICADGLVFTMDAQGEVRAFDAKNGDRKWYFDTTPENRDENAVGGGIAYADATVFATTGFGEVLALNATDGKLKWRKLVQNPIHGAPTIEGGRIYVISIDNQLQALDAKTGEVLWHHRGIIESATLMGASNPAASGEGVVVAYSSGEIFNLRPENGRAAWSYMLTVPTQVGALPAIADIRGLPVIDESRVYAISHSGRIAAIDQRTGDRVWEADIGGINTPLVTGDTIFVLSNDMQLVALSRDSGRVVWVQDLPRHEDPEDRDSDRVLWSGPELAANRLWLVNSEGNLVAFDPADGKKLTEIELSGPIYIPPIIAGNTMFVVLDSGRLIALR